MNDTDANWEQRLDDLWATIDSLTPDTFIARLDAVLAELPPGHAIALFERGAAQDSTGHSDLAVPLYRAALAAGLTGLRRRRASIQLASSLRNLGDAAASAELLTAELTAPSDELDGAVRAFLALALVDLGREREAASISLAALSRCLPRYNRSLARYAEALVAVQTQPQSAPREVQVRPATAHDRLPIARMLELYQHDLSDIWPSDIDAHGDYGYELDRYWVDARCRPFVALCNGAYAGFALVDGATKVRRSGHWMDQFFVMKKYRRHGVGRALATQVFAALPGVWEVGQMLDNRPAQAFWRRVIGGCADAGFVEHRLTSGAWNGLVQCFGVSPVPPKT
jgi:predicted acetyltransferase